MTLTALQKSRIRFHLGYMGLSPLTSALEVQEQLLFDNLPSATEQQLVGLSTDSPDQLVTIGGFTYDATPPSGSVLGYKDIILADTPDTFLRFGETSGQLAFDSSGNGHTYRYYNPLYIQLGVTGHLPYDTSTAVNILASTDYQVYGYISSGYILNLTGAFTLEFQFKASTVGVPLFQLRDLSTGTYHMRAFSAGGGIQFEFIDSLGVNQIGYNGTPITDNKWHTLSIVSDKLNSKVVCYLDGVAVITSTHQFGTYTNDVLYFGGQSPITLADASIVYKVISPSRIIERYNSTLLSASQVTTVQPPLASRYSLLGKVELAYAGLTSDKIDDSLLVETVGNIKLRGNELIKRKQLYNYLVQELADKLNTWQNPRKVGGSGRAGYTAR